MATDTMPSTSAIWPARSAMPRPIKIASSAIKAGFKEEKVFNMMGGVEGGKNKNKESSFYGQRWAGGWKQEGLPWTYSMDPKYMYQPDIQ